jgi:transposase-like protein
MMTIKEMLRGKQEYIVGAYEAGVSTCELGREFGCSNASVYIFLRDECGVQMKIKNTHVQKHKKEIKELFDKGMNSAEISRELKLAYGSVNLWSQKWGFKTALRHPPGFFDKMVPDIIKRYQEGIGCHVLAREFDCTETTILRLLRENGIERRSLRTIAVNESFFEKVDTEAKAYILGFAYGDGNNDHNAFRVAVIDREIPEMIKKEMEYEGEIRTIVRDKEEWKDLYKISVCSTKVCDDLTKLGCMPKKNL